MTDELARVLERTRQIRESRARSGIDAVQQRPVNTTAQNGTLSAGTRVFDLVTGEEGIVIHGARENILIPTANG